MPAWIHHSGEWPAPTSSESGSSIQNFPFEGPGIIRVVISAGKEVKKHYHNHSHSFVYILEGEGTVFLDGNDHVVKKGDVMYYPPKHIHGFKAGKKGLVLLAVENPRNTRPDGSRDTVYV